MEDLNMMWSLDLRTLAIAFFAEYAWALCFGVAAALLTLVFARAVAS
jgi:hypothetical protein